MRTEPTHVGQTVIRAASNRDQLRCDRNRNLLGSDGANIETDGSMDPVEQMCGYALFLQSLEDFNRLAFGPDHSDVTGAGLHRPTQNSHVIAMAAGDDDDIGRLVRIEFLRRLLEVKRVHFAGVGKAFLGGIRGAIICDDDIESCIRSYLAKVYRNVACTENIK